MSFSPNKFPTNFVIPRFWPHGIKIVHDVYIVFKSWKGAQGQGPAIDLVLCVSVIRVDTDDYDAKSGTVYFGTPCKYAINKIPQLAMHCNVKELGAWFHKE